MANEQRLGEFINNLLDDLQSGTITTEEALVAASHYEYIRALLSQRAEDLAQATAENDESLKTVLVSLFSQAKNRLSELPAFSSQTPDVSRTEKQTRDTATLEKFAFETLRKETKTKILGRKQTQRTFIHTLVSQYSARTNNAITEAKMDAVVDAALKSASREQFSQNAQQRFVKDLTHELGISDPLFEKTLNTTVVNDTTKTVLGSWRDVQTEKEALTTLFTHPDLERPDVLIDAFIHASDTSPLSGVSVHAVKIAQTAGAIAALGTKIPNTKGAFFSNANTKGAIKGAQLAADGILSLVGEPLREIILKEKINGTLRSVFTNVNQLADRLGENFIHSSVFGYVSQNILKATNEKPSLSQSTAIFGDVFGSIFRGPLNVATNHGTKESLYDYFELTRANSNAPKGFSFLGPHFMPWHITTGLFENKKRSGFWFPSVGLRSFGALGGNALSSIFDRFVGFAFAGPSISRQLHASRRAAAIPLPLSEDLPTLLAIFVVSIIILLFVFPTFLNIPHLSMTQKMSALLASLEQGAQGVVCSAAPESQICKFESCVGDCLWPTDSGVVSQGPYTTCGGNESTHDVVDGLDISGTYLQPIYSVTAGSIVDIVGGCVDNPAPWGGSLTWGCNKNYGNYVEVLAPDGAVLRYSHLSILFLGNISEGMSVQKGTIIGKMDNNGSSGSHHLHFEIRGGTKPSRLGKYLPISSLQMSEVNGCANNTAGCKACPNIPI